MGFATDCRGATQLGIDVAKSTVEKYRVRSRKPPSPTWKSFLNNHVRDLVSIDFFVVPTVRNKVLFVLVDPCTSPSQGCALQCYRASDRPMDRSADHEAFPWDTAPKYLLRDRDAIYGSQFQKRVQSMGIEEVLTAPRSPWQNAFVERVIGSIRRDCLDHVVVLNDRHLKRILTCYFNYYHRWRTHLSLEMDSPESRSLQLPALGKVVQFPEVGGLHHHYERLAA
jgi:putative transposase